MKKLVIGIFILIAVGLGLSYWQGRQNWQPLEHAQATLPQIDLRIETQAGQSHVLKTEIADTPQAITTGMMFRTDMPPMTAMLFVFYQSMEVSFWMKNTLVPLDMLFIDAEKTIRHIHTNAVPRDETLIPSQGPVRYVLEIPAGTVDQLHLAVGDKIFF